MVTVLGRIARDKVVCDRERLVVADTSAQAKQGLGPPCISSPILGCRPLQDDDRRPPSTAARRRSVRGAAADDEHVAVNAFHRIASHSQNLKRTIAP